MCSITFLYAEMIFFVVVTTALRTAYGQGLSESPLCQFCDPDLFCETKGDCCLTRKDNFVRDFSVIER